MDQENRVVVLVDMDCFYCQVEEKLNPELKGKPIAVVQYNPWKGGGIIAVNYVARAHGVTRNMRGDEAREKCPDIELPSVPCQRGKADITKYRDAGKEVARVLQRFTPLLERASIDEAYLDITAPVQERLKTLNVNTISAELMPNTYALGYDCVEEFLADVHTCGVDNIEFDYEHAKRLLVGAVIVSEIRAAVYSETGYRCSAGISHNKILAKLVCGMNKPNKQTVLPKHSINILYKTLSVKKVKHLGGKFGDTVCEVLKINKMGELQRFSEKDLQARFDEKNGTWLYNIARGIDLEPVQARFNPKSIGCCKQFRGKAALLDLESLRKWLKDLGDEIDDRLEKDALENNRTPKQMVVSYSTQMPDGRDTSSSRSYNFVADDELCGEMFSGKALELVLESSEGLKVADCDGNRKLKCPIKFLGISVGKFEDISEIKKTKKILDYFGAGTSKDIIDKPTENMKPENKNNENDNLHVNTKTKNIKNHGKDYIMQKFLAKQVTNKTDIQTNLLNKPDSNLNETSNTTETRNENPVNDILQKFLTKEEASKTIIQTNNSNKSDSNLNEANNTTEHESQNEMSGNNIMQKFLAKQETTKRTNQSNDFNNLNRVLDEASNEHDTRNGKCTNEKILESSLDKQESFFAKILNKNQKKELQVELQNEQLKPTTPVCDVIKYGEDSNDTDYSSSTINNEIDKSMALFDEDPDDVARLTNIRQLMNSSRIINEDETETISEPDQNPSTSPEPVIENPVETLSTQVVSVQNTETFNCTECGKTISIDMVAEHSDYHLALKLREEERQQVRKEIREKNANVTLKVEQNDKAKKKATEEQSSIRNESMSSITSFLVKIDDTVPTEICSECGRKVPLAKFGEHLDFHEAKKLSRELNKKTNTQFTGSSVKRKRKSASPIKKNKMPCKSIDSFFR